VKEATAEAALVITLGISRVEAKVREAWMLNCSSGARISVGARHNTLYLLKTNLVDIVILQWTDLIVQTIASVLSRALIVSLELIVRGLIIHDREAGISDSTTDIGYRMGWLRASNMPL
jgi:hypothetical protein